MKQIYLIPESEVSEYFCSNQISAGSYGEAGTPGNDLVGSDDLDTLF